MGFLAVGLRVVVSMVRTLESNAIFVRTLVRRARTFVRSYLAENDKFKKLCLPFAANGKHSLYGHLFAFYFR